MGRVAHVDLLITGVLCLSSSRSSVIRVLDCSVEPYSISRFFSILSLGFLLIYIECPKTKTKAVTLANCNTYKQSNVPITDDADAKHGESLG